MLLLVFDFLFVRRPYRRRTPSLFTHASCFLCMLKADFTLNKPLSNDHFIFFGGRSARQRHPRRLSSPELKSKHYDYISSAKRFIKAFAATAVAVQPLIATTPTTVVRRGDTQMPTAAQ